MPQEGGACENIGPSSSEAVWGALGVHQAVAILI